MSGSLEKYTTEVRPVTFSFIGLQSGETISSAVATVTGPDNVLTVGSTTYTNSTATTKLSAGTVNNFYTVKMTVGTSASNTYVGEQVFYILQ